MSGGVGFQLRPYQLEAVAELNSVAVGERRLLLVAPTGSGKTAMLVEYVRQRIAEGQRVLFLAHTREIIKQTSRKLSAHNLDHGIILAGLNGDPDQPVQVASVQTITARAMRTDKMPLPPAQLLVIDEAHHCPARTYQAIIKEYPNAVLIGATATPCRGDGRGLGTIFQRIVECPQVAELIVQKHLVKTLVYAPVDPDLRGVETRNGDYVETQLADRVDRDDLVGDIVSHWLRYGQDRQTVCFAVNVQHSLHICNEFNKAGVKPSTLTARLRRESEMQSLPAWSRARPSL